MDRVPIRGVVEMTKAIFKLLMGITLIVALIIVAPLLTIWSLNTLFILGIPYNWETWASAAILFGGLFGPSIGRRR